LTQLGIPVGTSVPINEIWKDTLAEAEAVLIPWKTRGLSIQGRVLIAKTMALSKFVYLSFALPLPPEILNELNKLIWKFIWDGKRDKVARSTTIQSKETGGLGCFHIPSYIASFRLKMLQRVLNRSDLPWTRYWIHRLNLCSGSWNLDLPTLLIAHLPASQIYLPDYWKSALVDLQSLNPSYPQYQPTNLFLNPEIRIDKKILTQRKWKSIHEKGLKTVNQIWDDNEVRPIQDQKADRCENCNKDKGQPHPSYPSPHSE